MSFRVLILVFTVPFADVLFHVFFTAVFAPEDYTVVRPASIKVFGITNGTSAVVAGRFWFFGLRLLFVFGRSGEGSVVILDAVAHFALAVRIAVVVGFVTALAGVFTPFLVVACGRLVRAGVLAGVSVTAVFAVSKVAIFVFFVVVWHVVALTVTAIPVFVVLRPAVVVFS